MDQKLFETVGCMGIMFIFIFYIYFKRKSITILKNINAT